jgi:hypothetical protein
MLSRNTQRCHMAVSIELVPYQCFATKTEARSIERCSDYAGYLGTRILVLTTAAIFFITGGREAGHPPPSSAEVKNGGAIPPLPHMSL